MIGDQWIMGDPPPVVDFTVSGDAIQSKDLSYTLVPGKRYQLVAKIKNDNAGTTTISLRLNGADVVGDTQMFHASTTTFTGSRTTGAVLGIVITGNWSTFTVDIPSIVQNEARNIWCRAAESSNATPLHRLKETTIYPTTPSSATALVSIGLKSNVSDGLGLTTNIKLYEMN